MTTLIILAAILVLAWVIKGGRKAEEDNKNLYRERFRYPKKD